MERRDFLRGVLFSAPAVVLGPGVMDLAGLGDGGEAEVAVLSRNEREPGARGVGVSLTNRINAHISLFGEPPKALFVNRYEARGLHSEVSPLGRFEVQRLSELGWNNMMWRGVPVICADHDVIWVQPEPPEGVN